MENKGNGEEVQFVKITISRQGSISIEENLVDKLRLIGLIDAGKQIMLNKILTPKKDDGAIDQIKDVELPDKAKDAQ